MTTTPPVSNRDIIEKLLFILVIIVAGALTLVGYLVLSDVDHSSLWGRIIAVPMEALLFVFQPVLEKQDLMPAICAGSAIIYFFAAYHLVFITGANWIKAYQDRAKKGGSTRI